MKLVKFGKVTMLFGLMTVLALVLAACGGDDPTATPVPDAATATPVPAEKPTLIFSDLDWNSAQIQNWIARTIAEKGYGYETDSLFGGTLPMLQALAAGDTNITMEIWLPNQQDVWDAAFAEGTVEILGNSLEDNWQSAYIIPKYTADANPGLVSVSDLPEYKDLFKVTATGDKGRMLTCIPGWSCEVVNEKKLIAYDLGDDYELVNPGSTAALDAEVIAAFEKGEDILFYYWGPTTLSHKLTTEFGGYVVLEEPAYTKACEDLDWGCAYPVAEVLVAMNTGISAQVPEIVDFLTKWDFNAGNQLAAEGHMNDSGDDFPEVAVWFLQNTEEWKSWVAPGVADKVLAGL
ncbi:MAG: ABC transporter substrate-binding protein [Chloroflexi bacterium]|nr:ABC transporter substrate-binding protein [Chloroflexota bacterium]